MPECDDRTEVAIWVLIGEDTVEVGASRPVSKAEADSRKPKDQPSSSQGCSVRCEGPMVVSTRRLLGSAKKFQRVNCVDTAAESGPLVT